MKDHSRPGVHGSPAPNRISTIDPYRQQNDCNNWSKLNALTESKIISIRIWTRVEISEVDHSANLDNVDRSKVPIPIETS